MIPLFSILVPQVTGDQAITIAKKALENFEVQGPARLQSLGGPYENGDRSAWHLKLSTPKFGYEVAVTAEGRVRYIERSDFGGMHHVKPQPGDAAKAERWLKRFAPRLPTRLIAANDFGKTTFFYQGLVKGLPVVYPRTGLGYVIWLEDGELFSFTADEQPPAVGSPVAKLTEDQALEAVARNFKAQHPPHDGWTFSYELSGPRELGWALTEGGGPAGLAWRVPYMSLMSGKRGSKGGSSGMLVDANTGESIKTKYSP